MHIQWTELQHKLPVLAVELASACQKFHALCPGLRTHQAPQQRVYLRDLPKFQLYDR